MPMLHNQIILRLHMGMVNVGVVYCGNYLQLQQYAGELQDQDGDCEYNYWHSIYRCVIASLHCAIFKCKAELEIAGHHQGVPLPN